MVCDFVCAVCDCVLRFVEVHFFAHNTHVRHLTCHFVTADELQPYWEPYQYVGRGKNKVGSSPDILSDSLRYNIPGVRFVMDFESCVGNVEWTDHDGVRTPRWDKVTVMNR